MNEQNERDKICYQEHCESFRHLNSQLWQVPIIAMTLNGGLWFGLAKVKLTSELSSLLPFFCGVCDILFIVILHRVRFIMDQIIQKMTIFNPMYAIDTKTAPWPISSNKLAVWCFTVMLMLASALNLFWSFYL